MKDCFAVCGQYDVIATTVCQKLVEPAPLRAYLLIQNIGTDTVFAKLGSPIQGNEGIEIGAGGMWEPNKAPLDAVYLLAASGNQRCIVIEGK